MSELWVVWSEEHEAWWRPGGHGYTTLLAQAGRFDEAKARSIEGVANRYLHPGHAFHEVAMPDPLARALSDLAAAKEKGPEGP